ncbi:MAG TPA: helix-turn-helix transcriptional regulator [Gemmatimonadales bacterium]|nr:helix-turn-helix transcriptional regulator [Gemmatimonadales bacterium]
MFDGEALRERREQMEISQEELAERVGVSSQTIGRWERGVVAPQGQNLVRLAEAIEKPLEFLFVDAPFRVSTA